MNRLSFSIDSGEPDPVGYGNGHEGNTDDRMDICQT